MGLDSKSFPPADTDRTNPAERCHEAAQGVNQPRCSRLKNGG